EEKRREEKRREERRFFAGWIHFRLLIRFDRLKKKIFTDGSKADYIGFRAVFQHNMADEQKPVRRCPAPAQRERFPKVPKHRANRFRTICTVCGPPPCPDFC
ncbi:hypothetical protein, partial [Neisseria gonorrhoeae]|uniref:hypothetical protein n=2 Tax=Neisseria gonorrhoeae TaxID=485 RepID=UPI00067D5FE6